MLTFFYLFLKNMLCHGSLFLHLKLNLLNYHSRKPLCTIRSYQITLTLAIPTRLPLSQMLSAPDQVLFQKKLTNFQNYYLLILNLWKTITIDEKRPNCSIYHMIQEWITDKLVEYICYFCFLYDTELIISNNSFIKTQYKKHFLKVFHYWTVTNN